MGKQRFRLDHVEDALRRTAGLVTPASRLLEQAYGSCTPATVRNYIRRYPRLQQTISEAVELNLDLAEGKLIQAIGDSNMTAIIFYLKTKGRNRGYIQRAELTSKDGEPLALTTLDDVRQQFESLLDDMAERLRAPEPGRANGAVAEGSAAEVSQKPVH